MKKLALIFVVLVSGWVSAQVTLTVSGTTYSVTGTETLNILNAYHQGRHSATLERYPFSAPVQVSELANSSSAYYYTDATTGQSRIATRRRTFLDRSFGYTSSGRQTTPRVYIIIADSDENARNLNGFISIVTNAYGCCIGSQDVIHVGDNIIEPLPENWKLYRINY